MEAAMSRSAQPGEGLDFVGRFAQWWQNWNRWRRMMVELEFCGPAEVEHIARDLGVSRGELSVLAGKWPDAADLLSRLLEQVNLDRAELASVEPQALRDLERVCTLCGSKRRCEHDLAIHPSHPGWNEYCPNAPTLSALIGNRSDSREPRRN